VNTLYFRTGQTVRWKTVFNRPSGNFPGKVRELPQGDYCIRDVGYINSVTELDVLPDKIKYNISDAWLHLSDGSIRCLRSSSYDVSSPEQLNTDLAYIKLSAINWVRG
jgi:hypothetical protein